MNEACLPASTGTCGAPGTDVVPVLQAPSEGAEGGSSRCDCGRREKLGWRVLSPGQPVRSVSCGLVLPVWRSRRRNAGCPHGEREDPSPR